MKVLGRSCFRRSGDPSIQRLIGGRGFQIAGRVVLVAALCLMAACGDVEVATVPSEKEAIEILTVLNDNGIDGHKEEVGEEGARQWRVLVDGNLLGRTDMVAAHRILHDHGLPRPAMVERQDESGLLPTQMAEKARYLREIEAKIENQLLLLPNVVRAKVNVAPFEADPIALKPPPATASALVLCTEKEPSFTETYVQNLVAGGVPQLEPNRVKVAIVYEPPHALPKHPAVAAKRNRLIAAAGSIVVLSMILAGLFYHMRRRRRPISSEEQIADEQSQVRDQIAEVL